MVSASNKDTESIYKESFHSVSLFSVVVKKVNKVLYGMLLSHRLDKSNCLLVFYVSTQNVKQKLLENN